MLHNTDTNDTAVTSQNRLVSLKTLALEWDADPSSVRRWLEEAGIVPIALGNGPRGAIRFKREEVDQWVSSRGDPR